MNVCIGCTDAVRGVFVLFLWSGLLVSKPQLPHNCLLSAFGGREIMGRRSVRVLKMDILDMNLGKKENAPEAAVAHRMRGGHRRERAERHLAPSLPQELFQGIRNHTFSQWEPGI